VAWRFRKSIRLGKGIRINVGKNSVGLSAGIKGAHVGVNSKRGMYTSAGIPGTGLYIQNFLGKSTTGGQSQGHNLGSSHGCLIAAVIFISYMFALESSTFLNQGQQLIVWIVLGVITILAISMNFTPTNRVKRLIKKANNLYGLNNKERAIEVLKEANLIKPNIWNVQFLLGAYLEDNEQYKEGLPYLQEAAKLDGNDMQTKLLLANCYYQTEQYETAISILQGMPETYERFIKVIELLGNCFAKLKKYDIAIDTFKRAPLLKRNLDADLLEIHYNMGIVYNNSGDKKNALKHFKKIYAINANYNNVGQLISEIETNVDEGTEKKQEAEQNPGETQ
jgi:tetratricopeptide (TPR) repeat protein